MLPLSETTRNRFPAAARTVSALLLAAVFCGSAAAVWGQEHRAPAPPHGQDARPGHAETAPPGRGAVQLGAQEPREIEPGVDKDLIAPPPPGSEIDRALGGGAVRQGPQEHGPAGLGAPAGGSHEVGEAAGTHGAAPGAGEHGEADHQEEEAFDIHLPTWIYGPLKKFWFSGPATLNADGAVGASGEALKGKQVEYVYEDHHSKVRPLPEYHLKPVLGAIGNKQQPGRSDKVENVTVDGQTVGLINPTIDFAYQHSFPEGIVVSLLTWLGIVIGAILLTRNLKLVPGKMQTAVEIAYGFFDNFVHNLIGPHYKKYVPIITAAFLYILIMNLVGIIPGWMSPTANINVTAGMALVVISYAHIEGIRANGVLGWMRHFVGEPVWLAPLNIPLHVIGEFAKLLSLTIRLFGNIFGEDVVIVILLMLGLKLMGGFPLHFPMLVFAVFTSVVQALVFSILASVYISMMTSHGHDEHASHDDHDHAHEPAVLAPA